MDALVNKRNHVPEKQRLYQAMTQPTYLRGPRSRLYLGAYLATFATSVVYVVFGWKHLILGEKKPSH